MRGIKVRFNKGRTIVYEEVLNTYLLPLKKDWFIPAPRAPTVRIEKTGIAGFSLIRLPRS